MHIALAIMNGIILVRTHRFEFLNMAPPACNFLKYVTLFSCDTFGFYVSWVSHLHWTVVDV